MKRRPKQYFRAGVGAVIARGDQVLVLERSGMPGAWQFPQGGLETDEAPEDAAWREVAEETGIPRSALRLLGRHPEVLTYALPPQAQSSRTGLGQSQFWFYFLMTGDDALIDLTGSDEFRAFEWVSMYEATKRAAPFRRLVYQRLRRHLDAAMAGASTEPLGPVTLREITDKEGLRAMLRLRVAITQEGFVADNATSIAQANQEPNSWLRAIYAGETAVGLILLYDNPEDGLQHDPPKLLDDGVTPKPEYYLWRLLIGARHQGRGYGREAVLQLAEYTRTRPNATELTVSYVPGDDGPQGFYEGLGFTPTGEVEHGEVIMRLPLTAPLD